MILYRIAPASFSTLTSSSLSTTSTRPPTLPVPNVEQSLLHLRPMHPPSVSASDDARFCSHILSQYAYDKSRSSLSAVSKRSDSSSSMSFLSYPPTSPSSSLSLVSTPTLGLTPS
ncbi:hypothetical protein VKT23_005365 [Stygiomarasmius scandens]|uniref:Uncharacterized protein n=1 Tax=Marasmiellus scandens TaxID=2682957 RepID=A0ABR1JQ21_9AGAR